ncbi:hypothetical protein BJD55_gp125 [Gordonia phage Yvonnetastic]|uniref:Uncharacterized protein n=1 Tax=Gordonia phage Yvonnetastic TaxID=1821566 RepID=A0A142K958_9CAUD|nr:hypothetical protein BJD55_gp125 [Gordonia phage Yvonnetastic]AMS02641.1 hypothetical protein SEA_YVONNETASTIC_97 [Gordonia phage Yvonnetastic]WKW86073.1 hypothetical protein SEA_JONJAMES_99 [Gordonia Phage JonJames]
MSKQAKSAKPPKIRVGDQVLIGRYGFYWTVTGFTLGMNPRVTITRPARFDQAHIGNVYPSTWGDEDFRRKGYGSVTTKVAKSLVQVQA